MQFSKYMADTENTVSNGDGEIRTLDPLLARQVLSQLSYTPMDAGLPSFQRRSLIHLCSVFISISQSLVALPFQVMGLSGRNTFHKTFRVALDGCDRGL